MVHGQNRIQARLENLHHLNALYHKLGVILLQSAIELITITVKINQQVAK